MHPVLVNIGPLPVYSFGFFSALAFLVGSFLFWRSLKDDLPEEELLVVSLFVGIGAVLGARIVPAFGSFLVKPTPDMFMRAFLSGSLSFWGGLLGGSLPLYFWQRKNHHQLWDLVDPLGPIFLFTVAITAIGSQLAGSWWGKPAVLLKAIGGVHPLGLYLSAWCLLGILLSGIVRRQYRNWTWYKSGKLGIIGLFCFSWFFLGFLLIATFSEKQLYWGPFALSQSLSLFILIGIIIVGWQRAGHDFKEPITWLSKKIR